MSINQYYNVPRPQPSFKPAAFCVCANYTDGEEGILRIIVRRDLSVKLKSLTVAYRFTGGAVGQKHPDFPYMTRSYDKEDLNQKEYITIRVRTPGIVPEGITAVVASVVPVEGDVQSYNTGCYRDVRHPVMIPGEPDTAERAMKEYFLYRRSRKNAESVPAPEPGERSSLASLAKKAAEATVIEEPDVQSVEKAIRKARKKRLFKRHTVQGIGVVAVLVLLVGGVFFLGSKLRVEQKPQDTMVARLLDDGRYADAYQTAMEKKDTEGLQNVCRTASAAYLFANDYDNAYLYAAAAPEPFDREIIDVFISLLLTQNRQEDAWEFLAELPQYTEAMQRVCQSMVDRCIGYQDYAGAYEYARKAPQSLETYVMQQAARDIVRDGHVNSEIFDALRQLEDSSAFDDMAQKAVEQLMDGSSYREAAAIACQIGNDSERLASLRNVCVSGMKAFVNLGKLGDAVELYTFCTPLLDENTGIECLQTMIDHARLRGDTGSVIVFTHLLGGDTSAVAIQGEDSSIRKQLSQTWFLLTDVQKRAYHARELDLYKEAFRIEGGRIEDITDAVSLAVSENYIVVLKRDGTAITLTGGGRYKELSLPASKDIVQVDAGREHVLLLHDNGTVSAVGRGESGQCNVKSWSRVVKVAAGADFTAALRSDGTLYACGSNISGQCEVDGITGVADIAACDRTLVLLMEDGSLRLVGDISMGLKHAQSYTGVTRIRAGGNTILAQTEDGAYMMAQSSYNANSGSVITWKNQRDFAAGVLYIGRIHQNGSMKIEGDGAPITHPGYNANGQ